MNTWDGVMQKHAKTFYLASLFFPAPLMPKVKALYALCRWLDDSVDEAPNAEIALKNLHEIADDLMNTPSLLPVNKLYKENNLDVRYMGDLIDGAKTDLHLVRIQNQKELIQYCYKVAGTVGLAMFDLMKVQNPQARAHAVDLGIAMQITNICRDIKEDLNRNRIYIPIDRLNENGITTEDFLNGTFDVKKISKITTELLYLADFYYSSAEKAFQTIPWRTRCAIIIASRLYRAIGLKLLKNGANPMLGRTFLTKREKSILLTQALIDWLFSSLKKTELKHNSTLHDGLEAWQRPRGFNV